MLVRETHSILAALNIEIYKGGVFKAPRLGPLRTQRAVNAHQFDPESYKPHSTCSELAANTQSSKNNNPTAHKLPSTNAASHERARLLESNPTSYLRQRQQTCSKRSPVFKSKRFTPPQAATDCWKTNPAILREQVGPYNHKKSVRQLKREPSKLLSKHSTPTATDCSNVNPAS